MVSVIDRIVEHASIISRGEHDRVRPGMPLRISEAAAIGGFVWQGDLKLTIVTAPPSDYAVVKSPTQQLVPGNTVGARHCLDSLDGVTMYCHIEWGPRYDGLRGPCFVANRDVTIEHPKHGHITVPSGMMVLCGYQREYDAEQWRERRNRD